MEVHTSHTLGNKLPLDVWTVYHKYQHSKHIKCIFYTKYLNILDILILREIKNIYRNCQKMLIQDHERRHQLKPKQQLSPKKKAIWK